LRLILLAGLVKTLGFLVIVWAINEPCDRLGNGEPQFVVPRLPAFALERDAILVGGPSTKPSSVVPDTCPPYVAGIKGYAWHVKPRCDSARLKDV